MLIDIGTTFQSVCCEVAYNSVSQAEGQDLVVRLGWLFGVNV